MNINRIDRYQNSIKKYITKNIKLDDENIKKCFNRSDYTLPIIALTSTMNIINNQSIYNIALCIEYLYYIFLLNDDIINMNYKTIKKFNIRNIINSQMIMLNSVYNSFSNIIQIINSGYNNWDNTKDINESEKKMDLLNGFNNIFSTKIYVSYNKNINMSNICSKY